MKKRVVLLRTCVGGCWAGLGWARREGGCFLWQAWNEANDASLSSVVRVGERGMGAEGKGGIQREEASERTLGGWELELWFRTHNLLCRSIYLLFVLVRARSSMAPSFVCLSRLCYLSIPDLLSYGCWTTLLARSIACMIRPLTAYTREMKGATIGLLAFLPWGGFWQGVLGIGEV